MTEETTQETINLKEQLKEVEALIIEGYSAKQIGFELGITTIRANYFLKVLKRDYNAVNIAHLSHLITKSLWQNR